MTFKQDNAGQERCHTAAPDGGSSAGYPVEQAALHESGHAVAHVILGVPFRAVTLDGPDGVPVCVPLPDTKVINVESWLIAAAGCIADYQGRGLVLRDEMAANLLSGLNRRGVPNDVIEYDNPVTGEVVTGRRSPAVEPGADLHDVAVAAIRARWAMPAYISFWRDCEAFVAACRPAVEAVAEQLLRDGMVPGADVARLTEEAMAGRPAPPVPSWAVLQPETARQLAPYRLWPCTDAAGSVQASNYAPGSTNPLVVTESKYGTANSTQAFGTNTSGLLGAQGSYLLTSSVRVQTQSGMWEQVVGTGADGYQGWSLTCTDTNFPKANGGVTVEFWFQTISPFTTGTDNFVCALSNATAPYWYLLLYINHVSGLLSLQTSGSAGSPTFVTLSSVNYLTGTPPLTHVAVTFNQTTYTAYINGKQTASGSWGAAIAADWQSLYLNGTAGTTYSQGYWSGYIGFVSVFAGELQPTRIMTHYQAGQTAMTGDTINDRIERLIQAAPYYGRRVILQDSGYYVTPCASCQDISGQAASVDIQNIVSSAPPAVLGISPAGEVVYLPRGYVYNQPVQWVLGDNTGAGEIPYELGFSTDYDPLRVINDVQLTQLDNQDIVIPQNEVAALDAASQLQYGDQPYWVTGYLENDLLSGYAAGPGLVDAANWLGAVNAKPQNRVASVSVDCASKPYAWPLFMHAARGQVVTVNVRPVTAPGVVMSVTGRISQTTRDLKWSQDGCTGTIGLLIDIAPELQVLTADDPTRGQLNGENILAW